MIIITRAERGIDRGWQCEGAALNYDIQQIKAQTDILAVIKESVDLKNNGRNWIGLCPFHQEKTPSFSVSPDKQRYYCFGCGQGGDVVDYVMKMNRIDLPGALRLLSGGIGFKTHAVDPKIKKEAMERRRQNHRLEKFREWKTQYMIFLGGAIKTCRECEEDPTFRNLRSTILLPRQIWEYHLDILEGYDPYLQRDLYRSLGTCPWVPKWRLFSPEFDFGAWCKRFFNELGGSDAK